MDAVVDVGVCIAEAKVECCGVDLSPKTQHCYHRLLLLHLVVLTD